MKEKKHLSILLPATVICILAVTIYFQMTNGTISVSNTLLESIDSAGNRCPCWGRR